jgi:hypothetical protein
MSTIIGIWYRAMRVIEWIFLLLASLFRFKIIPWIIFQKLTIIFLLMSSDFFIISMLLLLYIRALYTSSKYCWYVLLALVMMTITRPNIIVATREAMLRACSFKFSAGWNFGQRILVTNHSPYIQRRYVVERLINDASPIWTHANSR